MSLSILEKVKEFLIRLVKDEAFRAQLMSDKIEEARKAVEDGGYIFSQEEFEKAAIQILELKELGEFHDLSEDELVGAIGGITSTTDQAIQPLYGIIVDPPPGYPKPQPIQWIPRPSPKPIPTPLPQPQPLYGIVLLPPVQALYGVVVPSELQ